MTAPVALFVYNRPEHTRRALQSLIKNDGVEDAPLYVFSDGPKNDNAGLAVAEVRSCIRDLAGFKAVTIVERETNYGLARSIIEGVSMLCKEFGAVIVIEDDLVLAPTFLRYMNRSLERYRYEKKVMQVSGYMFPVEIGSDRDAFFLPFTTSWGWGTWARAWSAFDCKMSAFERLAADKRLRKQFCLEGAYDYFDILQKQLHGEVDSWAIRWYLSVFMENGLTLYPARTLVSNMGFDGSGTHCSDRGIGIEPSTSDFEVSSYPDHVGLYKDWRRVLPGFPSYSTGVRKVINSTRRLMRRAFRNGGYI